MRQLTALDTQFLRLEDARNFGHVSGLAVYEGPLEASDLCRVVGERLHLLPPFTWKLAEVPLGLGNPYWVEDLDFDLDFHIRDLGLPPGADDRHLAEQVARIVSRPLDRARPLWEIYVIHGLPEDRVGVLTKVHHSAVDGISGAEILGVLLDVDPAGRELDQEPRVEAGGHQPGQLELLGRGLAQLPQQPVRALRALPKTLPNLDEVPPLRSVPGSRTLAKAADAVLGGLVRDGDILERPAGNAPRTRFNGRITPHRRFAFGQLSLDAVKAVKNELGVTVNDVVVAICAGALREWLRERGELPEEPLVAMVPISVRSEEQMGTFGNKVSAMMVALPTDEADPRKRLLRTHETLDRAKTRHRATPAMLMQDVSEFLPPALMTLAARLSFRVADRARPAMNCVISNVPGPQIPLYLAGRRLHAHYPVSAIVDGMGLNVTVMSYCGHLDFGIVADRDQLGGDDAFGLMEKLSDQLDGYAGLARRAKRAERKRART